jgi:Ca-activated chloride channel family protein
MTFLWPGLLWLLLVAPLLVLAYRRAHVRRQQLAARYGSLGLAGGGRGVPAWQRHLPPALFLTSLVILIVSLARPQAQVSLPRLEGTVILAFDVSRSMAATDLDPTRIEVARTVALNFLESQPSTVRIGVVAFSNSGLEVQVPTDDQQAVRAALQRLEPQRGTSLGHGILAALAALAADSDGDLSSDVPASSGGSPDSGEGQPEQFVVPDVSNPESTAVILFSDGENNEAPSPLDAAVAARGQGVRVYTVGLGTPEGATLDLDGFKVHTQLDEGLLQQIAQVTGAGYYRAADQAALSAIYDDVAAQLVVRAQEMEVTALLAGAAVVVMLLGGALSLLWFGRVP